MTLPFCNTWSYIVILLLSGNAKRKVSLGSAIVKCEMCFVNMLIHLAIRRGQSRDMWSLMERLVARQPVCSIEQLGTSGSSPTGGAREKFKCTSAGVQGPL